MELIFNKEGNVYIAEFHVDADFNLHIEKTEGVVNILQRTSEIGNYAQVTSMPYNQKIIDVDFVGIIYPKYIKVTSARMPKIAVVTERA